MSVDIYTVDGEALWKPQCIDMRFKKFLIFSSKKDYNIKFLSHLSKMEKLAGMKIISITRFSLICYSISMTFFYINAILTLER